MSFALPKPKRVTANEVVLSREDWEQIVNILGEGTASEFAEDEDDIAAVASARAADAAFAAHLEAERRAPVETTIPLEIVKAELEGVHPIRAWRDYRGWTQADLAGNSGVARDLIAQMETRRKKGSIDSLSRLARAFGVPMEILTEDDGVEITTGVTR